MRRDKSVKLRIIKSLILIIAMAVVLITLVSFVKASSLSKYADYKNKYSNIQSLMIPPTTSPKGFIPTQIILKIDKVSDFKISNIVDLTVGLQDKDKYIYIVKKIDGLTTYFVEYIVSIHISEDINNYLQLNSGDIIVNGWPYIPNKPSPKLFSKKDMYLQPTVENNYLLAYPAEGTTFSYP